MVCEPGCCRRDADVAKLNEYLKRERAARRAAQRMLTTVLTELFASFELKGTAKWSSSRGRAALDALVRTNSIHAAAAAARVSQRSLYVWRKKNPSLPWRGKVAGFGDHWR